jgi:short-subunit dehydrogenase
MLIWFPSEVCADSIRRAESSSGYLAADERNQLSNVLWRRHMENLSDRWAIVTGASSGFGVHFANILAERKSNLVLVARRSGPMETLAGELRQRHSVQVVVEAMDLSRPGAGADLKGRIDARGTPIDILVNNAGYGLYGTFVDQPLEKIIDMLRLNMVTVTELTHIFACDMVKRRRGHILLTASFLGYQAVPGFAAYAATKAYVLQLGEALHQELKPHGVSVTALCPGASETAFGEIAGQKISPLVRLMITEPHAVAHAGIAAMLARRATVMPGFLNRATVFFERLMPRPLQRTIVGKVIAG